MVQIMNDTVDFNITCNYLNTPNGISSTFAEHSGSNGTSPLEIARQLVTTCPNICAAVYGNGNPDISGIGVYISFFTQAIYWILFRPLLASLFLLLPPAKELKSQALKTFLQRLKNLSEAVHGTSIFLNFTTLIAAAVRLRQSPPEYEALYLSKLSNYIFQLSSSSYITTLAFRHGPVPGQRDTFYNAVETISVLLSTYLVNAIDAYRGSLGVLRLVASACAKEHSFPAPTRVTAIISWPVYLSALFVAAAVGYLLSSRFPELTMKFYLNKGEGIFLKAWHSRKVRIVFFNVMHAMDVVSVVHGITVLYQIRVTMQAANVPTDVDNQWGFGQVTAIMIWVPMTLWMVRNLVVLVPWLDIAIWTIKRIHEYGKRRAQNSDDDRDDDAPWWLQLGMRLLSLMSQSQ